MRIEMTLRATVQFENSDGELKQWLKECFAALEAGKELRVEPMRSIPHTFFAKFKDFRLVFKREGDVIQVQDIVWLHEALQ